MREQTNHLLEGIIKRHSEGFGFFIPDDDKYPDIYISSAGIGSALTNDRVRIFARKKRHSGRRSYTGSIQTIVKRDKEFAVGPLEIEGGKSWIKSHNLSCANPILVSNPNKIPIREGDHIKVKIRVYPEHGLPFKAYVAENLGRISSSAKDDTKRIMAEYNIPFDFPQEVLDEIKDFPEKVLEQDFAGRKDLRDKAFVTIDGASAQDFDDAVFVEKKADFYRLYVAIADVSHYTKEGSLLDKEAFQRGNSSYFPDFCSPMLPEKLSNKLCSLQPLKERLAMTAEMDFDLTGKRVRAEIYPSVIKSRRRLTYAEAQDIMDGSLSSLNGLALKGDRQQEKAPSSSRTLSVPQKQESTPTKQPEDLAQQDYVESLRSSRLLAQILLKKYIKEQGLDLDIPETLVVVGAQGEPQDLLSERRLFSHQVIEHFMLSANKAVSAFLEKNKMPLMYRIHTKPEEEKLKSLQKFSQTLGFSKSFKDRKNLIYFLSKNRHHKKAPLINKLVLRSLSQARYSAFNKGHYGLNFSSYTHFTSPIRRYCDLDVHRRVKQVLARRNSAVLKGSSGSSDGGKAPTGKGLVKTVLSKNKYIAQEELNGESLSLFKKHIEKQAGFISEREYNSVCAERRIKDIKKARFLKKYVGHSFSAYVSSITNFGLFITLRQFPAEGLVRFRDLKGFWETDELGLRVRNKISSYQIHFGDDVKILIIKSNVVTGNVDFKLLEHKGALVPIN